jgi:hypothetical protein
VFSPVNRKKSDRERDGESEKEGFFSADATECKPRAVFFTIAVVGEEARSSFFKR